MNEQDFQELYDFLAKRHAMEADTIQMRATKRACDLALKIALDELQMIDENEAIDWTAEILKAFAQPYASHEDFERGWVLELMP